MTTDDLRNYAQAFALAAAGLFFLVKLVHGYLIVDLSIKATADRKAAQNGEDFVVVGLELTKGNRATLVLHDITAQMSYGDVLVSILFTGQERKSYATDANKRKQIKWDTTSSSNQFLQMSPGESTVLEAYAKIPSDAECVIDIRVLGKRKHGRKFGQWHCAMVSVPIS